MYMPWGSTRAYALPLILCCGITEPPWAEGPSRPCYKLLLYMPVDRMSGFEDFIREVKRAMNLLYPALKLVIPEDIHYLDEEVRGCMTSLTYGVVKKSEINQRKG